MRLADKNMSTVSFQVQNFSLSLVILCCLKLLYIMYCTNCELLYAPNTLLHFIPQDVYISLPPPLTPNEDCLTKISTPEYRFRISAHIKEQCREKYGGRSVSGHLESLPEVSLNSIALDKQRNFMYTAVKGAFGNKWSKLMVEVNKRDGGVDNLIKVAPFFRTEDGKKYLESSKDLFKFYFVRNPLDRVISGYYYYFIDLKFARNYLNGKALKELIAINGLNLKNLKNITFQQYLMWIIHGSSAELHFGVQYNIIQPCIIDYTLDGIFEILTMQRMAVANKILDLKTPKSIFTTVRDLTYLTEEANKLLHNVSPNVMDKFYNKYSADYNTWNYSKPEDWWYPYPGLIRNMRIPNPIMLNNDFPKARDVTEEDMVMLSNLSGEQSSKSKRQSNLSSTIKTSFIVKVTIIIRILLHYLL